MQNKSIAYLIYHSCNYAYIIIAKGEKDMLEIKNEYTDYTTKTFRLPVAIVEKLDQIAREHNTSMNKVVIQSLEFAIQNISGDDEG